MTSMTVSEELAIQIKKIEDRLDKIEYALSNIRIVREKPIIPLTIPGFDNPGLTEEQDRE